MKIGIIGVWVYRKNNRLIVKEKQKDKTISMIKQNPEERHKLKMMMEKEKIYKALCHIISKISDVSSATAKRALKF